MIGQKPTELEASFKPVQDAAYCTSDSNARKADNEDWPYNPGESAVTWLLVHRRRGLLAILASRNRSMLLPLAASPDAMASVG